MVLDADDEDLADAGVDEVVAKPVLIHELSGRLGKLLAAQSPSR